MKPTTVFRFFGYFPITSKQQKRALSKIEIWGPLAATVLLTACSILRVILNSAYRHQLTFTSGKGGIYPTIVAKSLLHILCSLVPKIGMIRRRSQLTEVHDNLQSKLSRLASQAEVETNERITLYQTLAFLLLSGYLSLDLVYRGWFPHVPLHVAFASSIPSILGYSNTVFAFVFLYHLKGYVLCLKNVINEIEYGEVAWEVKTFCREYGLWISMDIAHSFVRILFSSYFLFSFVFSGKYYTAALFPVLNDAFTVTAYCCVLVVVCRAGSEVQRESEDCIQQLESQKFVIKTKFVVIK